MTSQTICHYFAFSMGKSYTFVDVQVTDEGGETRNSLNACFVASQLLCSFDCVDDIYTYISGGLSFVE